MSRSSTSSVKSVAIRSANCLDLPDMEAELRSLFEQVQPGRVTTPGALAVALGDRRASVWIGRYLLHHDHDDACPCHRVVRAGGVLGPYIAGSHQMKEDLLRREGVSIAGGIAGLKLHAVESFDCSAPLVTLRAEQERIRHEVRLPSWKRVPRLVGAVDISYVEPKHGVAAHVLFDVVENRVVESLTIDGPARFPFISSYLSFRELPLLVEVLEEARRRGQQGELTLVDGSGILHPRRAGIASHLGVLLDAPTVGIVKKLLIGSIPIPPNGVGQCVDVLANDEPLGSAFLTTPNAIKPLFASPGHDTDQDLVRRLIPRLCLGHRLLEPIHWADRISRARAKELAAIITH